MYMLNMCFSLSQNDCQATLNSSAIFYVSIQILLLRLHILLHWEKPEKKFDTDLSQQCTLKKNTPGYIAWIKELFLQA